jgi:hypothetical protein
MTPHIDLADAVVAAWKTNNRVTMHLMENPTIVDKSCWLRDRRGTDCLARSPAASGSGRNGHRKRSLVVRGAARERQSVGSQAETAIDASLVASHR